MARESQHPGYYFKGSSVPEIVCSVLKKSITRIVFNSVSNESSLEQGITCFAQFPDDFLASIEKK
jgi:hypothetical protein